MILLEELRKIQNKFGYLKESEMINLSKKSGIPLSKIYSTASFYSFFRLEKKGKHVLRVCNNLPCMANGSQKVLGCLEKLLKIKPGETTKDGKFYLELTSCIGCCNNPPAMMVDERLFTNVDEKKLKEILKKMG